jgi:hypothetical protein
MVLGGKRIHTVRGSPVGNADYAHVRREVKEQWLGMTSEQKRNLTVELARADLDSVKAMKMGTKRRVERGEFDEDDVRHFYDDMDVWIKEMAVRLQGGVPDEVLTPMQKATLVKYAKDMAK